MPSPTISVIMPAYNCGEYVIKAATSILTQTFSDFEFLICDDGSSDDTWDQLSILEDTRITRFRNASNLGYLKTYNFLISKAVGPFITCQDADDWSEPSRLEEQLAIFTRFPEVSLVGCSGGFYSSDSRLTNIMPFKDGFVSTKTEIQPFILAAILYRRSILDKVPGFHPYFDRATSMDQYFVFNIIDYFKVYAIDRFLYTFRFNATSNSRTLDNFRKATAHEAFLLLRRQRLTTGTDWLIENREDELLEFEKSLLTDNKFMSAQFRGFAVYQIDAGQVPMALPLLWKALKMNPLSVSNYRTVAYMLRMSLRKLLGIKRST